MVVTVDRVVVCADRYRRWRYAGWLTSLGVVASPVALLGSLVFEGASFVDAALFAALAFVGLSGYGLVYSAFAICRMGDVSYVVEEGSLSVFRHGVEVRRVPVRDIEKVAMVGQVPERFRFFEVGLSYDWPQLVVWVRGERRPRAMPRIMIWGYASTDAAEREIRHALRSVEA